MCFMTIESDNEEWRVVFGWCLLKAHDRRWFVFKHDQNLDKFDSKSNVEIFLGYSSSSKAYRVYNNRTLCLKEFMHVTFNET
jgi:hypothetical protein